MIFGPDAAHIGGMSIPAFAKPAPCISYGHAPQADGIAPPELDYSFFSPEFMDEFAEYLRNTAVSLSSA